MAFEQIADLVYTGKTTVSGHEAYKTKAKNDAGQEVNVTKLKEREYENPPATKRIKVWDPDEQRNRVVEVNFLKEDDGKYYSRGIPLSAATRIAKAQNFKITKPKPVEGLRQARNKK